MIFTAQQIIDWISKHYVYKVSSNNTQLRICNPDGDKEYNLYINLTPKKSKRTGEYSNWVHDFRPNHQQYDGSFLSFVIKTQEISKKEALEQILGSESPNLKQALREATERPKKYQEEEISAPKCYLKLPESREFNYENNLVQQIALKYLESRAINKETITKNKLRYAPISIVFPYLEYGDTVYWQTRSIIGKVFNFPNELETGLKKTDYLYGYDNVKLDSELIVVESIFNSLSVGHNCVATGGAMMSSGKVLDKIKILNPKVIILAPDNDEAGIRSIIHNYHILKPLKYKLAYCLPPTIDKSDKQPDWNDMDKKQLGSARKYIENNTYSLNNIALSKLINLIKENKS